MIATAKAINRRLGAPPDTFYKYFLRHDLTLPEAAWFKTAIWVLFGHDLTNADERLLAGLVAAHGKVRVAQFLLWYREQFGEAKAFADIAGSPHIEHFDGDDWVSAMSRQTQEEMADLLAQYGY